MTTPVASDFASTVGPSDADWIGPMTKFPATASAKASAILEAQVQITKNSSPEDRAAADRAKERAAIASEALQECERIVTNWINSVGPDGNNTLDHAPVPAPGSY